MKTSLIVLAILLGISTAQATETKNQDVQLQVTEKGFEPTQIDVKPGTDVTLKVTRNTDNTCAKAISIPSKKIKKDLPLNKTVSIELGKLEKGEVRFACGMGMLDGQIIVH